MLVLASMEEAVEALVTVQPFPCSRIREARSMAVAVAVPEVVLAMTARRSRVL